ncbi:hypothetical protein, partial [Haematospirillum jordaniae]|uniref:hypothetical protein n=1 Tax=Haematospirillum jordaniae TaxID=1549855 RepID=UPI001ADDF8FF
GKGKTEKENGLNLNQNAMPGGIGMASEMHSAQKRYFFLLLQGRQGNTRRQIIRHQYASLFEASA